MGQEVKQSNVIAPCGMDVKVAVKILHLRFLRDVHFSFSFASRSYGTRNYWIDLPWHEACRNYLRSEIAIVALNMLSSSVVSASSSKPPTQGEVKPTASSADRAP